jgi:hypothetical protein
MRSGDGPAEEVGDRLDAGTALPDAAPQGARYSTFVQYQTVLSRPEPVNTSVLDSTLLSYFEKLSLRLERRVVEEVREVEPGLGGVGGRTNE